MLTEKFILRCENAKLHILSIRFINVLTEPAIPQCAVKPVKFDKRNLFVSGK